MPERYDMPRPPDPPVDEEGVRRPLSEKEFQDYVNGRFALLYGQIMYEMTRELLPENQRRYAERGPPRRRAF